MMNTTARYFKALSDPSRLALLQIISQHRGLLNVMQLQDKFYEQTERDLSQPTISHHLSILANAGFIEGRKDRLEVFYSLKSDTLKCVVESVWELEYK